MSNTVNMQIQEWRAKAAAGTLTLEETREAIEAIRKERANAHEKSAKARVKKESTKQAPPDSDALLNELGL